MKVSNLQVTSHVARDLLQSAALFRYEWLVVWEYVSNGLQYVDAGVDPIVSVAIDQRNKSITILDNGRGMSWADLSNFFIMHGENQDRKQGRGGRGYFGTGKSAAFGIADTFIVTTTKNGLRSSVKLERKDISEVRSGDPIPISTVERDVATEGPSGTEVTISNIQLRAINQDRIVNYIEKQIARWPRATVFVNHHKCEYVEPPVQAEYEFAPEAEPFKSALPGARLRIKVSKRPLEDEEQGIAIVSAGVLYETTLAGCERKELSQYIFGELDVPGLAHDNSKIPAFDMSRSGQLNRSNELVLRILAFVGLHVEEIRKRLVAEDRQRKATEEAKRLAKEASEIARLINSDFEAFRRDLGKMASLATGSKDRHAEPTFLDGAEVALVRGGEIPATVGDEKQGQHLREGEGTSTEESNNDGAELHKAPEAEATTKAKEKASGEKSRNRGGFHVDFKNLGEAEKRARYERESRTIFINLDHPQMAAAIGTSGTEDLAFKRLTYEAAFAEYSIALAQEMARADHFIDMFEPLTVVRETLNRLARNAAALYRSSSPTIAP